VWVSELTVALTGSSEGGDEAAFGAELLHAIVLGGVSDRP
jgi:hypothetical protein